jgi:hypothetical protein
MRRAWGRSPADGRQSFHRLRVGRASYAAFKARSGDGALPYSSPAFVGGVRRSWRLQFGQDALCTFVFS